MSAVPLGAVSVTAARVNSLTYVIEDGAVTITDCHSTASGSLVIPDTIKGYPFVVNWCDAVHADNQTDGTVVLLTFRIKSGATIGDTTISLSYNDMDVYNAAWESIYFQTQSGTITILEPNYGDLDGDDQINNRDLGLIQQYLNGWGTTINAAAADVNGDGSVNNRDLGLIQRYLNGWDVELGR